MRAAWVKGTGPGFEDAQTVRRAVFVEEQGFSLIGEFDDIDVRSAHVVLYDGDRPVGTGRIFEDEEVPKRMQVGRIAVLNEYRGRGLGRRILTELGARAKERGKKSLLLHAQADKASFYEKEGYAPTGRTCLDEGYPHVEMVREVG